jgi:hypothetical protein
MPVNGMVINNDNSNNGHYENKHFRHVVLISQKTPKSHILPSFKKNPLSFVASFVACIYRICFQVYELNVT